MISGGGDMIRRNESHLSMRLFVYVFKLIVIIEIISSSAINHSASRVSANHASVDYLSTITSNQRHEAICVNRTGHGTDASAFVSDAHFQKSNEDMIVGLLNDRADGWKSKLDDRVFFHGWTNVSTGLWDSCEQLNSDSASQTVIIVDPIETGNHRTDRVEFDPQDTDGPPLSNSRQPFKLITVKLDTYYFGIPPQWPDPNPGIHDSETRHVINHEFGHVLGLGDLDDHGCLRPDGRRWLSIMHNKGHDTSCVDHQWPRPDDFTSLAVLLNGGLVPLPLTGGPSNLGRFPTSGNGGHGADLRIDYQISPSPPIFAGKPVSIRVTFSNQGPEDAVGVTANVGEPDGGAFRSLTENQANCSSAPPIVCEIGALRSGSSRSMTMDAIIDPAAGAARIEARIR
jgi:hypothetical protein